MVVAMKKIIKRISNKEAGTSGISYAMYFVAIISTLVLFVFFKFNADLYVIEETMENGLHVAESRALTVNQDLSKDGSGKTVQNSGEYEREVNRFNIITNYTTSTEMSTKEQGQVALLAREFSRALQEQMNLSGAEPQGSMLMQMCGDGSKISISKMRILEPVYSKTVTRTPKSGSDIGKKDLTSYLPGYTFDVVYSIDQWIIYDVKFDENNNYISATKSLSASAPTLTLEGKEAEGATIDATLTTSFAGVRNIFAAAPSSSPVIRKDAIQFGEQYNNVTADAVDWAGLDTPIFASNPTQNKYTVQVSQSVDIVVAHQDKRNINSGGTTP